MMMDENINNKLILFKQKMFYYKLNLLYDEFNWFGSKACKKKNFLSLEKLQGESLLPAINFIFSRIGCDAAVKQCLHAGLRLTSPEEREEIKRTALKYTQNIAEEDLEVLGYRDWLLALERGIAAHHAGLLPSFKGAVEELFQKGLVKKTGIMVHKVIEEIDAGEVIDFKEILSLLICS